MTRWIVRPILTLALLLLVAGRSPAQTITGTILGTITDPSGASVPNAVVTVTNTETNQATMASANSLGNYEAPYLRPGPYSVKVAAPGFKSVVREKVELQVENRLRLDFVMEVGEVSTTVEVTGGAPLVESSTASLGQVIMSRTVVELPIRGRNVFDLVGLSAGVQVNPRAVGTVASTGSNAAPLFVLSDMSINGGRYRSNDFTLDGVSILLPDNNDYAISPTPDGTLEFKVLSNSYGPEFGRSGGGVVNVVTRGGTNSFHGAAYEFFRNDRLEANNFFANARGQQRGVFHFNEFGVSTGGPVVKNKTFFFAEYQGHRESNSLGGKILTMPTTAERKGDFSGVLTNTGQPVIIYDPATTTPNGSGGYTRTPFSGNIIPQNRIDPAAARMISYVPQPNRPGDGPAQINNWAYAPVNATSSDQWSARIDQRFTDKHSLFARVTRNTGLNSNTGEYGTIADNTLGAITNRVLNGVINGTYVFSPTRIWNYRYGGTRRFEGRSPIHLGQVKIADLGFAQNVVNAFDPNFAMFPTISPAGYATFGNDSGDPIRKGGVIQTLVTDMSEIHGRHTIKVGGDVRLYDQTPLQGWPVGHGYSFSKAQTQGPNPLTPSLTAGDGFASFLVGFGTGSINNTPAIAVRNFYYAAFVNDEIKLGKLTVNVGLRYDVETPRTERYNRFATFDFTRAFPIQVPGLPSLKGVLTHPGQNNEPRGQFDSAWKNFGPRVGLAYRVTNKLVVRTGYSILYPPKWGTTSAGGFGVTGEAISTAWVSSLDGVTPVTPLYNPYPNGLLLRPNTDAFRLQVGQALSIHDRRNTNNSYVQQWNFGVQQQFKGDWLIEVAYAGAKGTRLPVNIDFNQINPQYQPLGAALTQQVPNPFYGLATTGLLTNQTVPRSQLLRPYPQYLGMGLGNPAVAQYMGSSDYNSMTLRAEKRFSHGISLVASYTAGKLIDDSSGRIFGLNGNPPPVQDSYNLRNERSVSEGDVSQRFALNHTVELPFGRGKPPLSGASRALDLFVGGWTVSGALTMNTGFPLALSSTGDSGVASSRLRPNNTGKSAALSGSVQSRLNRYFDVSQFTVPAAYTFGNTARTLPDVRAPGLRNYNFALSKAFRVREPMSVLFRVESFNLTNTPYFGGANTPGGNPGQNLGSPDFGVISTSTNERQFQFSLKLLW